MDHSYAPAAEQQPPAHHAGYLETPYSKNRAPPNIAHGPSQLDHIASSWTSRGHNCRSYELTRDFGAPAPIGVGFDGFHSARYVVDPSSSSPFGCPPSGHFFNAVPTSVDTHGNRNAFAFQTFSPQLSSAAQPYEPHSSQTQPKFDFQDYSVTGLPFCNSPFPQRGEVHDHTLGTTARAEDETVLQRKQDQQWLRLLLQGRNKIYNTPQSQQWHSSISELRQVLYSAARLISQLDESCDSLRTSADNHCVWKDSYIMALKVKRELQEKLTVIDLWNFDDWKTKLYRSTKRRARRHRERKVQQNVEEQRNTSISERHAVIDAWRLCHIRQVEEKKKEQELKLVADAVLCEVRKKQADVLRMQDVLRSLEKLRKLRKEAASRKGIVIERQCEDTFSRQLDQLRCVLKSRTSVYAVEEKALKVMLEGEQEEERRREEEKLLKKKCRMDAILFGEFTAGSFQQPFSDYYTQADHSLDALLQIRKEWDVFLVSVDHPDSSSIPQNWILPDVPSDQVWASALHSTDSE